MHIDHCQNGPDRLEPLLAALEAELRAPLPGRPAHAVMAPRPQTGPPHQVEPRPDARQGGVLVLLYPHENRLWTPFILRAIYHGVHSGQVGFPGGGHEPGDVDLVATALREAHEEIGVPPSVVRVLGRLSPLYIAPSNFQVHPVVGFAPQRPRFRLDPYEVADLIETPLATLLDPANVRMEARVLRDQRLADVPFYAVRHHVVWGATAMILGELLSLPALQALAQLEFGRPQGSW